MLPAHQWQRPPLGEGRGGGGGYGVVAFYSSAPERDSAVPCFPQVTAERTKYSNARKKHHSQGYNICVVVKFHFLMFETYYHKQEGMSYIIIPKKTKGKNSTWDKIEPQRKLYTKARVFRFLKFISGESRGQLVVCRSCKTIIFHIRTTCTEVSAIQYNALPRLVYHLKYVHCVGFRVCAHIVVRSSVKCSEMGVAFMELNPVIQLQSPFIKLFKLNSPIG